MPTTTKTRYPESNRKQPLGIGYRTEFDGERWLVMKMDINSVGIMAATIVSTHRTEQEADAKVKALIR